MKLRLLACLFTFLPGTLIYFPTSIAKPCYPTDPTGSNPDNLCLIYPPAGVQPNSFVHGVGSPVRELPTVQNPAGNPIINPKGFWTNSVTTDQGRTIKDSGGNTYNLSK